MAALDLTQLWFALCILQPTNFTNPMYDTLYNDNASGLLSPDQEKNTLLKEEKMQVRFYGEEERQPLGHSDS